MSVPANLVFSTGGLWSWIGGFRFGNEPTWADLQPPTHYGTESKCNLTISGQYPGEIDRIQ